MTVIVPSIRAMLVTWQLATYAVCPPSFVVTHDNKSRSLRSTTSSQNLLGTSQYVDLPSKMSDIALTTTFTPPASCFDNSYTSWNTEYYIKGIKGPVISCYPPGYTDLLEHNQPFSPGVCPEKYVVVTQMLLPGTGSGTGSEQGPTTTRAYCCPRQGDDYLFRSDHLVATICSGLILTSFPVP